MKLLLDENLSRRIVPFLQNAYPGSTQVALVGLEQASDQEIWCYARGNNFVIVTKDSDYYELSLVHGDPPKIIWLKTGNTTKSAVVQMLLDHRKQIEELLIDHGLCCAEIY